MNYYDEEITIGGPNPQQLSHIKVERLPSGRNVGASGSNFSGMSGGRIATSASRSTVLRRSVAGSSASRNRINLNNPNSKMQPGSLDDDGLLQDIVDHDDDDDETDDEIDIETRDPKFSAQQQMRKSANQRSLNRPASNRNFNIATAKVIDNDSDPSESESDENGLQHDSNGPSPDYNESKEPTFNITPEKWENLSVHEEIKELFPFILKYTPQNIEIPYHLQPFIPEYIPAIGDVDAFLKVIPPPLLKPDRQDEINEHINNLGLTVLDEPAGEQSEPSLLNMKLRSVLTGSGVNPRSASASLIPTVKQPKDIDKWINEVEQVHMAQSINDVQLRCDIDNLMYDWPQSFADAKFATQNAYQRCFEGDLSLDEYIRFLSERFNLKGPLETQMDYLLNVHSLFALYLVANRAWE